MTNDEPQVVSDEKLSDDEVDDEKDCSQLNTSRGEGSACTICFEPYTSVGSHRVVCLRCGHLFGKKCINRWLAEIRGSRKFCPTCKQPCKRSDIREHFCRGVQVTDNSELHDALQQLEKHRQMAQDKEVQIATLRYKCVQYEESIKVLEAVIEKLKK
ncbi:unnamed protein product [Soboliphyme baturini]|uniref:RING-type domain-containing protein n=1 Tax=Soboliphyme baturini TaxID=241478 RepID=A0A183IRS2_9BILA|nr:unnamed protein product [Soboliphyme baturini]